MPTVGSRGVSPQRSIGGLEFRPRPAILALCLSAFSANNLNLLKEKTDEIHDQLVRTSSRIACRIRECPEADPGGFHSMEGSRQFQDRGVRRASGRVGWAYVGGLRRSDDRPQGMLDLACFCLRGTTGDSRRGRCSGRTRNHRLARRTQTQVTFERITSHTRK